MSSFLKTKRRESTRVAVANTKKHIKHFYKRLHELDLVAQAMVKSGIAITDKNVSEEASRYLSREVDSMEQKILLSKVAQVYEAMNIKVKG